MKHIAFLLMVLGFCSRVCLGQDPVGAKRFTNQMMHVDSVNSITISPDGKYIVSGSDDKTIKIWDMISKKEIKSLVGHSDFVYSTAISPDGKYIVSGSEDKTIKIWDMNTGKELKSLVGHSRGVYSTAISPNGEYIVSGSDDKTIKIWDMNTGKGLKSLVGHSSCVYSIAISPNGKYIVSGSEDKTIKIWDMNTGKELKSLVGHSDDVNSVAISSDGKYIVSGSNDKTIKIWDMNSGKELKSLVGHSEYVVSVAISANGKYIVSGSDGGFNVTIKIWDINAGKELKSVGHSDFVYSTSISPDGKYIVSGSEDNTIKIWDINTGKELKSVGHSPGVSSTTISPDGKYIVSGSHDNTIKIWDINTGKELKSLVGHSSFVYSIAISPDGKYIVSGSDDDTIKIWDMNTGKELKSLVGHSRGVYSTAIGPDGKHIVSAGGDNTIKIWDMNTGKELKSLIGHNSYVFSAAISLDGKYIVTGSHDKTIKIWDVNTGKMLKSLVGHSEGVSSVAISPDGKYIVSGSNDRTIKTWDMNSGKELKSWQLNNIPIHASFSNDGKEIIVATIAYWVTFPIQDEKKEVSNNPVFAQTNKIYWTFPNARKYTQESLKVSQNFLNIEAIISTNLSEKQLREALQVWVNGTLQTGKLGNVSLKSQQQEFDFEQSVQLDEGANKIEIFITAPNQEVVKSISLNVFYTPPQKANLYLFTFGVQFSDLNYTDEDATVIHKLFSSQRGLLFNQIFSDTPLINNNTNADAIGKEFERLGNRDDIREQDVVLVFGSSHGGIFNDKFRIYGRDFEDTAPRKTTIDFNEDIIANLDKLNCKKVILLDACRSGASVGKSKTDANTLIANTPPGTVIITSSSKSERSYENEAWQNSSFVKAIREGLEEAKANTDGDGYVTIKELFSYLQKRVPSLVKSVKALENLPQNPQMKMENLQDFPIYKVK
jgi:WD40 repeat protein